MSVEALALSGIVDEGSPKAAFQLGINKNYFDIYAEEFEWVEKRFEKRKPINRRVFCERFTDFEYVPPQENLTDILNELKTEKAYLQVYSLIDSVSEHLRADNSIETAEHMREVLAGVVREFSPHSEISLQDHVPFYERAKQNRILAKRGESIGMPSMIPSIDFHWDGFIPGRLIGILARPGMGKSSFVAWIAWMAIKNGYKIGLFSPEMDEFEHGYRLHTLASADPEVQKACGIKHSFHNRDLMRGTNFNMKDYKRFCEYFDSLPGSCQLFTKKYRRTPMTPQYVAMRVEDLGLQGIIADPLSKLETIRRRESPIWEMYDKVGQFQEMAEEYNIFAIATNWSHRGHKTKEDAPDLDESFGSDALAQESDHIIGLMYDAEERTLMLRCTKSRFGQGKFRVTIDFHPNTGYWREVEIPMQVQEHRLVLNGKALTNGTTPLEKSKVEKVIAAIKAYS